MGHFIITSIGKEGRFEGVNSGSGRAIVGFFFLGLGVFLFVYSVLDIYYNRPDMPLPVWGYGIASAVVGLILIRLCSREKRRARRKGRRRLSLASIKTIVKERRFVSRRWRRDVSPVIAFGAAVFLFGLVMACLTGYLAHSVTNEDRILGREFDTYQLTTVLGILITSIGIGIVIYGLFFEDNKNDAGGIRMSAAVIGAVVSAFGLGSALWAGLATLHMEMLQDNYEAKYEGLRLWSIVGFWVGSIGIVITAWGLASSFGTRTRKRLRA